MKVRYHLGVHWLTWRRRKFRQQAGLGWQATIFVQLKSQEQSKAGNFGGDGSRINRAGYGSPRGVPLKATTIIAGLEMKASYTDINARADSLVCISSVATTDS